MKRTFGVLHDFPSFLSYEMFQIALPLNRYPFPLQSSAASTYTVEELPRDLGPEYATDMNKTPPGLQVDT
jgi:hypothetical protein